MGATILSIVQILACMFLTYKMSRYAYRHRDRASFIIEVWQQFRPLMFIEVCIVIALVICSHKLLIKYIPFLSIGWASIIFGKTTNFLTEPFTHQGLFSAISSAAGVLFFTLLLLMLPFLAKLEEDQFRRGMNTWRDIIPTSFTFGFLHLILGIPLAAGFVLSFVGIYFASRYRLALSKCIGKIPYDEAEDRAVMVSTVYHTLYNTIIACILLISLVANLIIAMK